ncbi:MAG: protein serine/threonine phosphatase [Bacteroidetes bacterium]|jgi:serine phosphatase RsbU (regulator of sigma subunit)/tetratricopeptide (TPR) repeat protein|nr:protein serine/threonine phosphatase [Bacteroidota bacterium]
MRFTKLLIPILFLAFGIKAGKSYAQTDSLLRIVKDTKIPDSSKYQPLFSLISYYIYRDMDTASLYTKELKTLAVKNNSKAWEANAILQEGIIHYNSQRTKDAIPLFEKSAALYEELKIYKGLGNSNNNIGLCYQAEGEYEKAVTYFEKALQYYRKTTIPVLRASVYNNLGLIYIKQHAYANAAVYLDSAIALYNKTGDEDRVGIPLLNLALVKSEQLHYTKSLDLYFKALKIFTRTDDIVNKAIVYNNVGNIYTNIRNYPESIRYLKLSLALRKELEDSAGIASCYINLALNHRYQKDFVKQKDYIDSASLYIENYKTNEIKMFLMEEKMLYHVYKGNPDSVVYYQDLYKSISNDLVNQDISSRLSEMSVKYKTEEAERMSKLNSELAAARQEQLEKEHRLVYLFVIVSIVVSVFLVIIFFALGKVKVYNKLIRQQQSLLKENYSQLQDKNHIIEEKQKEILDSITYAKKIQETILASRDFIKEYLPAHFIFFQPKDIVSGDFYWATKKDDLFYLAVCDSTGHGVPGAFMSLLNISFLNEAINKEQLTAPGQIFNYVRKRLISTISQDQQKDGFDGVLLCFDLRSGAISYSAANNAPVLVSGAEMKELPLNKMPVGKGERVEEFGTFPIEYAKGDMLFVYTDGYADQFGGPKGKKFKYKPLEQLLLTGGQLSPEEQSGLLDRRFTEWKGVLEQVDDVLVVGIRL